MTEKKAIALLFILCLIRIKGQRSLITFNEPGSKRFRFYDLGLFPKTEEVIHNLIFGTFEQVNMVIGRIFSNISGSQVDLVIVFFDAEIS